MVVRSNSDTEMETNMAMKSNTTLFENLFDEFKAVKDTARSERYGIYVKETGLWLGENGHWVDRAQARSFSFVTEAEAFATFELDLNITDYNVGVI